MRTFLKYILGSLSIVMVIIYSFFMTNHYHKYLEEWVGAYLSKETYNKIEVISLNFENYPFLVMDLKINSTSIITLQGKLNNYNIDMLYHLKGDSFHFNDFHINDNVDVNGTLKGSFSNLKIEGKGKIFDGDITYKLINTPKESRDVSFLLTDVNSSKVLEFLEEKPFLSGKADINAQFKVLTSYKKDGQVTIDMKKAVVVPLSKESYRLHTLIDFKDINYNYNAELSLLNVGTISIKDGTYHEGKRVAKSSYKIHLKKLEYFGKRFNLELTGKFDSNGTVLYKNGSFLIEGESKEFGGLLEYRYKNENFDVYFNSVSLDKIVTHFPYQPLLSSKLYGAINFNLNEKIVLINLDLNETHFLMTKLTDMVYSKAEIDMLKGVYNKSFFSGGYKDSLFSFTLKIDDGINHLYLTNTRWNILNNKIYTYFEMKMQKEEITGEVTGFLNNPNVHVDKRKIFTYQTEKYLIKWFGNSNMNRKK